MGLKCPGCKKVYLPPRPLCGNCYAKMEEWVEVKDTGIIRAFTVVNIPIHDATTGKSRPAPYGMALIQLDGADTTINHFLEKTEVKDISIGMKVRAVWRGESRGNMGDIMFFRLIENGYEDDGVDKKRDSPSTSIPQYLTGKISIPFNYAVGEACSRFFAAIRDKGKILGSECPECKRVIVPARSFCTECFVDTKEWIEVSDKGTLITYTVIHGALPHHPKPLPFAYGIIRLDGADTNLVHILDEVDIKDIRIGMRLKAVFSEKPGGTILDILYFKPISQATKTPRHEEEI